jgi:cytoskeletal protein RodZ
MSADRSTGSFGAKLRDARERRGVSLRQIANATKISVAALEALERNDISRLPGGIFSRAFVRSYAIEVGLDPEATIQEFIAQFPNDSVTAGHPSSDRGEDHEAVESDRQTAGTFLWLAVISVPLAIAVLYFTASGRGQASRPQDTSAPVASDVAPKPPPELEAPRTTPEPPPAAPEGAATVAPKPAEAPTADAEAPPPAAVQGGRLSIALSVKRPCWVSATVDGQKKIERLLQPGERETIDVRKEMVLTAGDASAIALTLNGADARPLGKAGEVVTARINTTNFKSFLQAR